MNYTGLDYAPMEDSQVTYTSAIDGKRYPLAKTDSFKVVFDELVRAGDAIRELRQELKELKGN